MVPLEIALCLCCADVRARTNDVITSRPTSKTCRTLPNNFRHRKESRKRIQPVAAAWAQQQAHDPLAEMLVAVVPEALPRQGRMLMMVGWLPALVLLQVHWAQD